jgi:uncharacterized protein Yka (UPF0111/DUF47 family)
MNNKEVRKYIKYLCHQADIIENDINEANKRLDFAQDSLRSIKTIINQLSNEVYKDENNKESIKYVNQYKDKVDVVYETASGKKKELNVPLHPYYTIDGADVFARVKSITSESKDVTKDYLYKDSSMEEKAKAMASL